ncbi:MAG: hypothetical protein IJ634_06310, partial [Bacteroidales bacterium]|nr:hypothetical protein [Bacteroidales bacterium]
MNPAGVTTKRRTPKMFSSFFVPFHASGILQNDKNTLNFVKNDPLKLTFGLFDAIIYSRKANFFVHDGRRKHSQPGVQPPHRA